MFQSAMVLPNFIFPICGGAIASTTKGMRVSVVLFLAMVMLGQLLFWWSTVHHHFITALIARVNINQCVGCSNQFAPPFPGRVFFYMGQCNFSKGSSALADAAEADSSAGASEQTIPPARVLRGPIRIQSKCFVLKCRDPFS